MEEIDIEIYLRKTNKNEDIIKESVVKQRKSHYKFF